MSIAMGRAAIDHYSDKDKVNYVDKVGKVDKVDVYLNLSCNMDSLPGYLRLGFSPLTDRTQLVRLGRLELDVYVPGAELAFEYQGQQHFYAIEAWGGEEALSKVQERDARKARLCAEHGVTLITVDYTEPLTETYIRGLMCAERDCDKGKDQ